MRPEQLSLAVSLRRTQENSLGFDKLTKFSPWALVLDYVTSQDNNLLGFVQRNGLNQTEARTFTQALTLYHKLDELQIDKHHSWLNHVKSTLFLTRTYSQVISQLSPRETYWLLTGLNRNGNFSEGRQRLIQTLPQSLLARTFVALVEYGVASLGIAHQLTDSNWQQISKLANFSFLVVCLSSLSLLEYNRLKQHRWITSADTQILNIISQKPCLSVFFSRIVPLAKGALMATVPHTQGALLGYSLAIGLQTLFTGWLNVYERIKSQPTYWFEQDNH